MFAKSGLERKIEHTKILEKYDQEFEAKLDLGHLLTTVMIRPSNRGFSF